MDANQVRLRFLSRQLFGLRERVVAAGHKILRDPPFLRRSEDTADIGARKAECRDVVAGDGEFRAFVAAHDFDQRFPNFDVFVRTTECPGENEAIFNRRNPVAVEKPAQLGAGDVR